MVTWDFGVACTAISLEFVRTLNSMVVVPVLVLATMVHHNLTGPE